MATNPLTPYAELVAGDADDSLTTPVGLTSGDPFNRPPLSQAAWDMMNPEQQAGYLAELLTSDPTSRGDSDDDEDSSGDFYEDVELDRSQVERGESPPIAPRAQLPDSEWRDQTKWPKNRPSIDPDNTGDVHEFDTEGRLSPEQERQRRRALADNERIDSLNRDINILREDINNPASGRRRAPRNGTIEPKWTGEREYESANPLSRYVKKLRDAWNGEPKDEAPEPHTPVPPAPVGMIPSANDFAGVPATRAPKQVEVITADDGTRAAVNAAAMIRKPIVPGGESFDGADVAGLARIAWGEEMPNLPEEQLMTGRAVRLAEARPGDLVGRVDDAGRPHLLGVYLKDGEFVAEAGGQFAKRRESEYADRIFGVRVGERDRDRGRSGGRGGVDLSPAAERRLARDVSEGFNTLADSLADLFGGGKKKDGDRDGGGRDRDRDGGGGRGGDIRKGDKGHAGTGNRGGGGDFRKGDKGSGGSKGGKTYKGKRPGPG